MKEKKSTTQTVPIFRDIPAAAVADHETDVRFLSEQGRGRVSM